MNPALVLLARALALGFGAFSLLNLAVGFVRPGFDANLWWIDLRPLPPWAAIALLAASGVVLVAFGLRSPRRGTWRWRTGWLLAGFLTVLTTGNAFTVVRLAGGANLRLGFPVPLSAAVAAAFALITWQAWRGDRTSPGHRERVVLAGLVATLPPAFALALMVCLGTTDYRRPAEVAVVFGARTYADGRPSDALANRVQTACDLYRAGLVRRLVMSGGPGDGAVHETEAMRRMAMAQGVPASAVVIDPDGLSTAATVRNTAPTFRDLGPGRVLAVSHAYHLPRVKLAYQRAGIDVRTVPAEDEAGFGWLPSNLGREIAALWFYYLRAA